MEDLAEKLSGILNDPQSMAQVKSMAESLFSGNCFSVVKSCFRWIMASISFLYQDM